MIVPGICNSSESVYVRTFVYYAQCHGYRCAVLNHLGVLASVELTAPRMFTYGHTDDLRAVVKHLNQRYPTSKIILLGYSLGGNLITKYLGEEGENVSKYIGGGISVCQGYNILEGTKWWLQWTNFRRIYLYFITEAVKSLILRHRKILLSEQAKQMYELSETDIISAATLPELDEAYTRKVHNFKSVPEVLPVEQLCKLSVKDQSSSTIPQFDGRPSDSRSTTQSDQRACTKYGEGSFHRSGLRRPFSVL
uniref:AB hydrolase-1 domain-containing protein n=1 Tax=Lygus hesperus TaxID=30085 RepID=A0A0K8T7E7_LYGHE